MSGSVCVCVCFEGFYKGTERCTVFAIEMQGAIQSGYGGGGGLTAPHLDG